jgi:sulfide dehydrogenase cytochrome subunit
MQRNTARKSAAGGFALVAALVSLGAGADDPEVNRLLASQCSQCHGTNGYAVGDIDSLAGESVKDLREDLEDMQFEDAPEDMMDHQALGYSDDQIRRIATYFATLPEDRPRGLASIDLRPASSGNGSGSAEDEDREERDEDRDHDDQNDADHEDRDRDWDRQDRDEDEDDEDEDEDDEDHEDDRKRD